MLNNRDGLESGFDRPDKFKMPSIGMEADPEERAEAQDRTFIQKFMWNFNDAMAAKYPNATAREKEQYADFAERKVARLTGIPLPHPSHLDSPLGKEGVLERIVEESWEKTREEMQKEATET